MTEPRLYIIMREDLWDMNPGKGMAQAAHAQAAFDAYVEYTCGPEYTQDDELWNAVGRWKEDRDFGVTYVLSAVQGDWHQISLGVKDYGYVEDPTYPYRNYYKQVFTRKEQTCMWVFATTDEEIEHMKRWRLHP